MNERLYEKDLSKEELLYLLEVWHLSKVNSYKRYDRLLYTQKWFIDKYSVYQKNKMSIYKILDELTQ